MTWRSGERFLTHIIRVGFVVAPASFVLHDFVPAGLRPAMMIACSVACYVTLLAYCARVVVQRIVYGCEHPLGE